MSEDTELTPKKRKWKLRISVVSFFHYLRLTYRSVLFILLLLDYIFYRVNVPNGNILEEEHLSVVLIIVWIVFVIEMVLRFIPSRLESPGSQKQFKRNYIKSGNTDIDIPDNHATFLVALIWIVFNGIFGSLHMVGIFDDGIMILLASLWSVGDMICILFFCPFQTLFLKNKCCSSCRIYNWDYAMMFTPLFFVKHFYTWSLLGLSIILLAKWEITFYKHPERFSERTNDYLHCVNCTEKLCAHKKQLRGLWKNIEKHTAKRLHFLKK